MDLLQATLKTCDWRDLWRPHQDREIARLCNGMLPLGPSFPRAAASGLISSRAKGSGRGMVLVPPTVAVAGTSECSKMMWPISSRRGRRSSTQNERVPPSRRVPGYGPGAGRAAHDEESETHRCQQRIWTVEEMGTSLTFCWAR